MSISKIPSRLREKGERMKKYGLVVTKQSGDIVYSIRNVVDRIVMALGRAGWVTESSWGPFHNHINV